MIKILTLLFRYKVFVVAALLTFILSSMISSRVSILKTGAEITLLSNPVDPRDFFRGNYVTMTYDVSNLDSCKVDIQDNFERNQMVFVQLEQGKEGYWYAVAASAKPLYSTATTVVLSGYSRGRYTADKQTNKKERRCPHIRIRYGLEKYFAPKKRAKALEDMRRGQTLESRQEIEKISKQLLIYRKEMQGLYKQRPRDQGVRAPEGKTLYEKRMALRLKTNTLRKKMRQLRERSRVQLAVIVRVSKTGEGVISGLMMDGKKVYDTPL